MIKIIGLVLAASLLADLACSQTHNNTYAAIGLGHTYGRCTGSASCTACRNCSKCAHCNSGGSCGVCSHKMKKKAVPKNDKKTIPVKPNAKSTDKGTLGNQDYYLKMVELHVEKANLRKGPAVDFPIIATIYRTQKLICLSNIGNWAKVQTDKGLVGFIRSDVLKISNNP